MSLRLGGLTSKGNTLGLQPVIVIRPGDRPAFWLRLTSGTDGREIELGVLDAIALLLGHRVELAIETAPWATS